MADCNLKYRGKTFTHEEFSKYIDSHKDEFKDITDADKPTFARLLEVPKDSLGDSVPTKLEDKFPITTISDNVFGIGSAIAKDLRLLDGGIRGAVAGQKSFESLSYNVVKDLIKRYDIDQANRVLTSIWNDDRLSDAQCEAMVHNLNHIMENWSQYSEKIQQWLKSKKVGFDKMHVPDVDYVLLDDNKEQVVEGTYTPQNYGVDITKIDAKQNASAEIKFIFDTMVSASFDKNDKTQDKFNTYNPGLVMPPTELSTVGMDKPVGDNKFFYKVMNAMVDTHDLLSMEKKFRKLATSHPELIRPYEAVFGTRSKWDGSSTTPEQWRLISQFEKAFTTQNPDYLIYNLNKETGENYIINANKETDSKQVVSTFINTLIAKEGKGNLVQLDAYSNYTVNPEYKFQNIPSKNPVEFLNEVGFDFPKRVYDKLSSVKQKAVQDQAERLKSQLGSTRIKGGKFITEKNLTGGQNGTDAINELADLYVEGDGASRASAHMSVDGESVSNYILPNNFSRLFNKLGSLINLSDLKIKFPKYNDVFSRNSLLLSNQGYIFGENGKVDFVPKPTITEGLITSEDKTTNSDMNLGVRFVQAFNMNLGSKGKGNFYNVIPADSKSEWGSQIKHYITLSDFMTSGYNAKVDTIFKNYLADEIDTIKDFNDGGPRSKYEQLNKTVSGTNEKIGQRLRFFKEILNKDLVKTIHDYANSDSDISTADFIGSIGDSLKADISLFLDKKTKETLDFLKDSRIVEASERGSVFKGLNTGFISEIQSYSNGEFKNKNYTDNPAFSDDELNRIVEFRNVNHILHNIELHKVWLGDPGMYKDETKRIKLFLSGKEFTHTDGENEVGLNLSLNKNSNKVGDLALKPGQLGYHNFKDTLDILTYDHNDSPETMNISPNVNQYIESLGAEKGELYANINGIDAQSHMGLPWTREFMSKSGVWNDAQEAQYQYDMALMRQDATDRFKEGETKFKNHAYQDDNADDIALQKSSQDILAKGNPDNAATFYIIKPLGSGIIVGDTMTPFALKTSTFTLSWEMVKDTHLENMYLKMLETGAGYAGPKSQQKVGTLEDTPTLYDKSTGMLGLHPDIVNNSKQSISWEDFGKIVETAGTHTKTTLGSQLAKQDTFNLFDGGMPVDFFDKNKDDFGKKLNEWQGLTEAEKIEKSDYYRWFDIKNKSLEALSDFGAEKILNTLGIKEGPDGHILGDPQKLISFIENEILTRELPENMKDGLSTHFNPETNRVELTSPLESLSNFNQIKSIINSTIDKNINKAKVNGGQKILVSAAMFDSLDTPLKLMLKGPDGYKTITHEEYNKLSSTEQANTRLFSDRLKSYTLKTNEDGTKEVTRMQVLLPSHFKDKMDKMFKKSGVKLSDEQLYDYLHTAEGKKLLQGIGFRIPTQGQNSIDSFEIVPFDTKNKKFFMPSTHGDCIVVPAELATKVGSDFDVDKLNCYLKNFYIDKEGYPKLVEFDHKANSPESLKKLYEQKYNKNLDGGRTTAAEYNLMLDIATKYGGEGIESHIPSLEEFIAANKDKDIHKLNSREAVENRYFDNLHDIICNPESFKDLITPNDATEMKGMEDLVNKTKQRDFSEEKKKEIEKNKLAKNDLNYGRLLDPLELAKERQNFMEAKGQVGIAASNNSSTAISQPQFLKLVDNIKLIPDEQKLIGTNDLTIKLPHNQFKMKVNGVDEVVSILSRQSSVAAAGIDSRYISDKLSQVIDGTVDAAKDPWLMRLFPSEQALSTALFLTRMGTPMNSIVLFLHQPSILAYIKEQNNNTTLLNLDPNFDKTQLAKTTVIENVKGQFDSNSGPYANRQPSQPFTITELSDAMAKFNAGKKLTASEDVMQKQILDEFVKYNIFAGHLFNKQQGDGWDTIAQPSMSSVYLKQRQLEQSKQNNVIAPTDLNSDFRGNRKDNIQTIIQAFGSIFKSGERVFHNQVDSIWKAYSEKGVKSSAETKRQIMDKAQTGFINFLTQNFYELNGKSINTGIKPLLIGDALLKKLALAKADNIPDTPEYNMALDKLKAQYSLFSRDYKNITISEKPKDKYASDSLTESFRQLKETNPDLYKNIIIASHLQYGITDSRLSVNKYIPVEDYLTAIKSGLASLEFNNPDHKAYTDANMFYKNSWGNEDICPTLPSYYDEDHRTNITRGRTYIDGLKGPVVLLKSDSNMANYPVVKAKSQINPITGAEYTFAEKADLQTKGFTFKKTVELYRRIEDERGNPISTSDGKYIYKQVNALGDGNNLQEYYTDNRPSVRDMHFKVNEHTDDHVLDFFDINREINTNDPNFKAWLEAPTEEARQEILTKTNLENPDKSSTFADKDKLVQNLIDNKEIKTKDC